MEEDNSVVAATPSLRRYTPTSQKRLAGDPVFGRAEAPSAWLFTARVNACPSAAGEFSAGWSAERYALSATVEIVQGNGSGPSNSPKYLFLK
jgi:hypothetical protein